MQYTDNYTYVKHKSQTLKMFWVKILQRNIIFTPQDAGLAGPSVCGTVRIIGISLNNIRKG